MATGFRPGCLESEPHCLTYKRATHWRRGLHRGRGLHWGWGLHGGAPSLLLLLTCTEELPIFTASAVKERRTFVWSLDCHTSLWLDWSVPEGEAHILFYSLLCSEPQCRVRSSKNSLDLFCIDLQRAWEAEPQPRKLPVWTRPSELPRGRSRRERRC